MCLSQTGGKTIKIDFILDWKILLKVLNFFVGYQMTLITFLDDTINGI